VTEKPVRRRFTAKYKLDILKKADAAKDMWMASKSRVMLAEDAAKNQGTIQAAMSFF